MILSLVFSLISELTNSWYDHNDYTYDDNNYEYSDPLQYREVMNMKSQLKSVEEVRIFARSGKRPENRHANRDEKILTDVTDPAKSIKDLIEESAQSQAADGQQMFRDSNDCEDNKCVSCVKSCDYLRSTSLLRQPLTQFFYLALCTIGCRREIKCFVGKYCLPIMRENPNYFIFCVNSCSIFPIIPLIFVS